MIKVPKFPMSIWGKLQSKKYERKSENRCEFLELSFDWNCRDTPLCGPLSVVIKDFCLEDENYETLSANSGETKKVEKCQNTKFTFTFCLYFKFQITDEFCQNSQRCKFEEIGLELFEKYKNPIFSIYFRVRRLKLKIAKVNLKS